MKYQVRLVTIAFSLFFFISSIFYSTESRADVGQGAAINYIHGEGELDGIKLAYQVYLDTLHGISPDLELALETSVNFWRYGEQHKHDTDFVVAASPILRYPLFYGRWVDTYLEGGIGVAFLDNTYFAGKDVGLHFQFEDRIGLAFRFGGKRQQTLSLTYLHYSNAGISKHNPGIDLLNLAYSWRF
ncbi:acyloxyacyl hydrolase [Shewanella dokdonensis]|uniref:Lipid A deacylase n=1 Tax=Shewanella dokdonensis TaxID=712036 RepID=A0ABX8DGY6_9GAMM|nr:acyloxyacyl hydrolase [Shewanella dokdonensis]MCL1074329.1 acyloxyacyl hydrolase [Shewanella dokdonensis]QVK24019.1 acyloxyacyl hydrolase [Shewanella dokdonensis]